VRRRARRAACGALGDHPALPSRFLCLSPITAPGPRRPFSGARPPRPAPASYVLARSLGCGTRVCSDAFDAGGRAFRLEVYPSGVAADGASHIGVFLTSPCGGGGGGGGGDGSSGSDGRSGGSGWPAQAGHLLYEIAILDRVGLLGGKGAGAGPIVA
jgi:hypothetical protein